MVATIEISWLQFKEDCKDLVELLLPKSLPYPGVYGVPTGGSFVALEVSWQTGLKLLGLPIPGCLVVDDLIDSGRTIDRYKGQHRTVLTVYRKPHSPRDCGNSVRELADCWVTFPWEVNHPAYLGGTTGAEDAVIRLIQFVGENPKRAGLERTPERVIAALREMTGGYALEPARILETTFAVHHDEMVLLSNISFTSLCEHHLLPFLGTASVGYIPGKVVGISKLARLVDCYARRLQVQERMTQQIADAVERHLEPVGVGVILKATHLCMACRGIRQANAKMITSAVRGAIKTDGPARAEWLRLAGGK